MNSSDFTNKALALAAAGQQLYQRGWVPATSGNFSMRLDAESALLTASGRHKGRLTEQDFIAVDLDGKPLHGGTPSAETLLHTQLYRRQPDTHCVLHCHSPSATVISRWLANQAVLGLNNYELLKAFDGIARHDTNVNIPIFDNTQDIPRLARQVDAYLDEHPDCPAYLIRGHGVYCWARDIDGCMRELEALDFLLQCELEQLRLAAALTHNPGRAT